MLRLDLKTFFELFRSCLFRTDFFLSNHAPSEFMSLFYGDMR